MQPEETQSSWQIDALAWFETHKLQLAYAGAAALALWLAAFTYKHVRSGKEAEANAALAALNKPGDKAGKQAVQGGDYLKIAEQHAGTKAAARALLFAADRFFAEGKYSDAKARFERHLAADPTSPTAPTALLGIAACIEAMGTPDKAVEAYEQVISLHGSSPVAGQAKLALGLLQEQRNQPEQALRYYDELLRAKPPTVWRMEAEMRRDQLLRRHPQLAGGLPAAALPATNAPVVISTNAPAKK